MTEASASVCSYWLRPWLWNKTWAKRVFSEFRTCNPSVTVRCPTNWRISVKQLTCYQLQCRHFFRPFLFITNFGEPEFKLATMKHLKGKLPFRTEVMWKVFFVCLFLFCFFFLLLFLFLFLPHRLIILFLRGCCISKWVNEWMNE